MLISIIFSRLWPKISMLQSSWEELAQSIPAFKSLIRSTKEYEAAKELELHDIQNYENPIRIVQGIECRNIHYRYDPYYSSMRFKILT